MAKPYWEKLAKIKKDALAKNGGKEKFSVAIMGPQSATKISLGVGSNGILEPEKPVAVDTSSGRPVVLHEGEQVIDQGRQREVLPVNNLRMLNTPEEQEMGEDLQDSGAQGMQSGGIITKQQPERYPVKDPYSANQNTGIGGVSQPSLMAPQPSRVKAQNEQNFYDVSDTINNQQKQVNQQAKQGSAYLQSQPKITQAERSMQQGMINLNQLASGDSPYFDRARETAESRMGGAQAAEKAAAQQQMAQKGVSQPRANVLGQTMDRQQGMERGQVQSDLATAEAAAQQQAGTQLLQAGQQVAGYEQAKAQDQYQKDLQKMQTLLQSGGMENIEQAEQLATQIYGQPMDFRNAKVEDVQNRMSDIGQLIESGAENMSDEALQTLANKYGEMWKQQNALKGLEFETSEIETIKNNLLNDNLSEPQMGEVLGITENMGDWWTEGEGMPMQQQLSGRYKDLQMQMSDPDIPEAQRERSGKELGELVGSVYYAANGYPISEAQKKLIEDAGLGHLVTTESEAQAEESQGLVEEFASGARNDYNTLVNELQQGNIDKETYQSAINNLPLISERTETKNPPGFANRKEVIPTLETKDWLKTPTGEVVKKVSQRNIDRVGKDQTEYTLQNINTGETYTVTAGERGWLDKIAGVGLGMLAGDATGLPLGTGALAGGIIGGSKFGDRNE